MALPDRSIGEVVAALRAEHPELGMIAAAATEPVYVVGGVVRDQLLGRGRSDIDVVVVGDAGELARSLAATPIAEHERFATAKVEFDGHEVDIAAARTETYSEPGALPTVAPGVSIEDDLGRRDFTINAMAIPLPGEPRLIDPHGGRDDLERGLLRVLHGDSFVDDPTRAIRAARYAARFGFTLEEETERLLRDVDLSTVSEDRRRAELLRLAGEPTAIRGFELLVDWGTVKPIPGGIRLAGLVAELLATGPWREEAPLAPTLLAAAFEPAGAEAVLAAAAPARPSEGVELARRHRPTELVLARALGGTWLDDYVTEWRSVRLEIDGDDLIAAGVPEGPAVGRGLDAALRAKLDGEVEGRAAELTTALAAAGQA